MKKAAVICSGGGIKGIAQIGALKVIQEFCKKNHVEISCAVGTSVGAITAALAATHHNSDEVIEKIFGKKFHIITLKDIIFNGSALFRGRNIRIYLKRIFGEQKFSALKCDLLINATDLFSAKEFVFSRRGLYEKKHPNKILSRGHTIIEAISGSIAVPVVFEPLKADNLMLTDGGIINPLAIDLINFKDYDYVFVLQSNASLKYITPENPHMSEIIYQTISVMQNNFIMPTIYKKMKQQNNVVHINIPLKPLFVRKKVKNHILEYIKIGEEKARQVIKSVNF